MLAHTPQFKHTDDTHTHRETGLARLLEVVDIFKKKKISESIYLYIVQYRLAFD